MTEIEFAGQACTMLRCGSITLSTDPWFSPAAIVGGWHPYPRWTEAEISAWRERIDASTHVYISHAHEDHFDVAFLASLAPKTLLVGDFPSTRFRAALDTLSPHHTLRWCGHGERIALSEVVAVTLHLEAPAFRTNSMLVVDSPDGRILNANDCGLNTCALTAISAERPVSVFLYTLNFIANGYPFA